MENQSNDRGGRDESQIENLLSEKLMDGFVLLEKSCPVCATPLVKSAEIYDDDDNKIISGSVDVKPTLVPSGSFEQPFIPVGGVPFCVSCQSHVITQECEISILERCDSLKNKGSILVALQDGSTVCTERSISLLGNKTEKSPREPTILEEKKSEGNYDDEYDVQDNVIDVTHESSAHDVIDVTGIEDIHQAVPDPNSENEVIEMEENRRVANRQDEEGYEKKEEEEEEERVENQNTDEVMAEYSVR